MATMQSSVIPRVKLESNLDGHFKPESVDVEMTSPYADSTDDGLEDGGDLDFTNAQHQLWLTQIPRSLWQECSNLGLDDEIEIGTIRVEGPPENPQRISLKLNPLNAFQVEHKEWNLKRQPSPRRRGERPGQALIFSEQDLPGYKAKPFSWELLDDDGNPGQGRSQLFEKRKRDQQRKENDGRFEPYKRKPIPKKTALVGTVVRELEADPVRNKDYEAIEDMKARLSLMPKEQEGTKIYRTSEGLATEKILSTTFMATAEQRRAALRDRADRRNRQQETRGVEMSEEDLRQLVRELFKQYPGWKMSTLKAKTRQSQKLLDKVLGDIAFKHTSGDLAGVYQLSKDENKLMAMLTAASVAPEELGTDDDDDEEGNEEFVNALMPEFEAAK